MRWHWDRCGARIRVRISGGYNIIKISVSLTNIADEILWSLSCVHKVLAIIIVWIQTLSALCRNNI